MNSVTHKVNLPPCTSAERGCSGYVALIEFNVVLSIAWMLSDALVSLEATVTMTLGNRLLTLESSWRDGGMQAWMEGQWKHDGGGGGGKQLKPGKKQQASDWNPSDSLIRSFSPSARRTSPSPSVSDFLRLPLQRLSPKFPPPPSLLVSSKLITLLTLLDFLWTVHLALFRGAALPLIQCLFTLWQWKGKQYWVLLTGGDEEKPGAHRRNVALYHRGGWAPNQIMPTAVIMENSPPYWCNLICFNCFWKVLEIHRPHR